MKDLYKREICINCANDKCSKRIEIIRKLELMDKQMKTATIIRCKDFICKKKRKQTPLSWQKW